jgi:hypothetical protein
MMPDKQLFFEDGSSIAWVDRETLRYEAADRHVLVWVEYETGFFKRGRVIRGESLRLWSDSSGRQGPEISPSDRIDIVTKVQSYFSDVNVRVQEGPSSE